MGLLSRKRRNAHAGSSARAKFRARRWKILRQNWRDWVGLTLIALACLAVIAFTNGITELVFAALFGAALMMALVGWIVGDVHSLPWLWGSIGEELTEEVLDGLDGHWICEHDLPSERGNFDHVLVGPPGVFLLDTKRLSQRAVAGEDRLRAGRVHHLGAASRAAAAELGEQFESLTGRRPWVQSVVVVWGDFPQGEHDERQVLYVHGTKLLPWLLDQPPKLETERLHVLGEALPRLRQRGSGLGKESKRWPF
jgi:hypothetical protein